MNDTSGIIAGLGEVLWDIYGSNRYLGGAIANCVHHVNLLGGAGMLISRIGDDQNGSDLRVLLENNGFDTKYLQIDMTSSTGWVKVTLNERKEPEFTCNTDAAYDYLEWDPKWEVLFQDLSAVIFGTFAQRTDQASIVTQRFIGSSGRALKVFDLNIRAWNDLTRANIRKCLPMADVLKLNEEEYLKLIEIYPDLPQNPLDGLNFLCMSMDIRSVFLTAGPNGCLTADGKDLYYSPGFRTDVVDTTGAGDAFISAATVKLLEGKSPAECAEFAGRVAAEVVRHKGATPEYSPSDVVNRFSDDSERIIMEEWMRFLV